MLETEAFHDSSRCWRICHCSLLNRRGVARRTETLLVGWWRRAVRSLARMAGKRQGGGAGVKESARRRSVKLPMDSMEGIRQGTGLSCLPQTSQKREIDELLSTHWQSPILQPPWHAPPRRLGWPGRGRSPPLRKRSSVRPFCCSSRRERCIGASPVAYRRTRTGVERFGCSRGS